MKETFAARKTEATPPWDPQASLAQDRLETNTDILVIKQLFALRSPIIRQGLKYGLPSDGARRGCR